MGTLNSPNASIEHAAKVWWTGGKTANRKLEAIQERVGRKVLGASGTVAGVAIATW